MLMKTNIHMLLFDIEHCLSDIRGPRYLHLKKVYFFVGHPVQRNKFSMIEINLYRSRIGRFDNSKVKNKLKTKDKISRSSKAALALFQSLLLVTFLYSFYLDGLSCYDSCRGFVIIQSRPTSAQPRIFFQNRGKHQTNNFKAKLMHGNTTRGIKNIHINIRSLFKKTAEIRKFVKEEKPHILGISEA